MAHQLYVLQVLTFNLLEDRMMTKMDPQDQVSAHSQQCRRTEVRACLGLLRNQEIGLIYCHLRTRGNGFEF